MVRWLRFILLAGTAVLAINALGAEAVAERRFQDADEWARRFDDPSRDAWQKPREVIRALELARDAVVADIGSGRGYFAVRLARAVPDGRVYGADRDMARQGYAVIAEYDFLPYQCFLVFRPQT